MSLEIESLLYKQVKKPKHHYMTKVINLWDNRYRINVYIEIEQEGLMKRKIAQSYFCHYSAGNLTIVDGLPKSVDTPASSGILAA
jgi:hypothetical protein